MTDSAVVAVHGDCSFARTRVGLCDHLDFEPMPEPPKVARAMRLIPVRVVLHA